jgi:hypothetical protein
MLAPRSPPPYTNFMKTAPVLGWRAYSLVMSDDYRWLSRGYLRLKGKFSHVGHRAEPVPKPFFGFPAP